MIDLQEILAFVSGWTIRFLASGVKVIAPNAFKKNKDYGYADVILWEYSCDAHIGATREAIFSFRQQGPKKDYLWRTAISTLPILFYNYKSPLIPKFSNIKITSNIQNPRRRDHRVPQVQRRSPRYANHVHHDGSRSTPKQGQRHQPTDTQAPHWQAKERSRGRHAKTPL